MKKLHWIFCTMFFATLTANAQAQTSSKQATKFPKVQSTAPTTTQEQVQKGPSTSRSAQTKAGKEPISIIKSSASVGGTFIRVGWTPSAAVGAFVFLSEEEIEVGFGSDGFPTVSGPFIGAAPRDANEEPEVVFTNLDPSRKYYYAILPMNDENLGNGQVTPYYRVTKTLKRGVHIKATKLEVHDDSDDLSDGEMAFTFLLLPPTIHPKDALMEDLFDFVRWPELSGNEAAGEGYLQVCSGAVLSPSVDLTAFDVGNEVRYAVSGYDDDVDGVYDVGPLPYPFQYTGAFDAHYGEANANFWTLDIDGGSFESSTEESHDYIHMEQFERKLVASAPSNDTTCLEFKVHFTVSVFLS